jgi:hypothetical protein
MYEQYGTPKLEYDYPFMLQFEGASLRKWLIQRGGAPLVAKASSPVYPPSRTKRGRKPGDRLSTDHFDRLAKNHLESEWGINGEVNEQDR